MNIKRFILALLFVGVLLTGCDGNPPPQTPPAIAISATSVVNPEVVDLAPTITCTDCTNRALIVRTFAINWGYPAGSTLRVSYEDYLFIAAHGGCTVLQDYA